METVRWGIKKKRNLQKNDFKELSFGRMDLRAKVDPVLRNEIAGINVWPLYDYFYGLPLRFTLYMKDESQWIHQTFKTY